MPERVIQRIYDHSLLAPINQEIAEPGVYEVRWYGSPTGEHFSDRRARLRLVMGEEWADEVAA